MSLDADDISQQIDAHLKRIRAEGQFRVDGWAGYACELMPDMDDRCRICHEREAGRGRRVCHRCERASRGTPRVPVLKPYVPELERGRGRPKGEPKPVLMCRVCHIYRPAKHRTRCSKCLHKARLANGYNEKRSEARKAAGAVAREAE